MECWNDGVMERWNEGARERGGEGTMEFPNHFVLGIPKGRDFVNSISLRSRLSGLVSAVSRSDLALLNQLVVVPFIKYFFIAGNYLGEQAV